MPHTRSKMGQLSRDRRAEVSWCAVDIQELRPEWTVQQCNEFLMENEDEIQGQMILRGWDVLAELLRGEDR